MRVKAKTPNWGIRAEGRCGSEESIELDAKSLFDSLEDGDYREPSFLEVVDNRIYFYGEVDRHRILQLNKKLRDLNISILQDNIRWSIPETPHIYIHINSMGGPIFSGLAGMDEIMRSLTPVTTIIDGCCASAATFMSIVGSKRLINKNAFMMIHQLSSEMWGTYSDFKDHLKNLDMFMEKVRDIYKQHTKVPQEKLDSILKHDLWFDAKQCLEYGLVDEILE